jgi:hypothetical protein
MSFSIATLLIRNLHDVFGENDPRVGARPSTISANCRARGIGQRRADPMGIGPPW